MKLHTEVGCKGYLSHGKSDRGDLSRTGSIQSWYTGVIVALSAMIPADKGYITFPAVECHWVYQPHSR